MTSVLTAPGHFIRGLFITIGLLTAPSGYQTAPHWDKCNETLGADLIVTIAQYARIQYFVNLSSSFMLTKLKFTDPVLITSSNLVHLMTLA